MIAIDRFTSMERFKDSQMRPRFPVIAISLAAVSAYALAGGSPSISDQYYSAIRNNDLASLAKLIHSKGIKSLDADGNSPLLIAAADGSAESLKLLLSAGCDPNTKNFAGAVPLMWCANDVTKMKMLLAKGAKVNARAKSGRTPLEIAAYYDGNIEGVRLLIQKGAEVKVKDLGGITPLELASENNSVEVARLLLAKGANPNTSDLGGFTPLMVAAASDLNNGELVNLLIKHGASVKTKCVDTLGPVLNGNIALGKLTALHQAVTTSYEATKALIDAGADVNALDVRGANPLAFAVATDHPNLKIVKLLLDRGSKVDSAIPWAKRYNNAEVLALFGLPQQNVDGPSDVSGDTLISRQLVQNSITKALTSCQVAAAQFRKKGGCISCHSQMGTGLAVWTAKSVGLKADYALEAGQAVGTFRFGKSLQEDMLQVSDPPPGIDGMENILTHLKAASVPQSLTTDALVHYVLAGQHQAGDYPMEGNVRPPTEDGLFTDTAKAIRVLKSNPIPGIQPQIDAHIEKAAKWLAHNEPVSTEDRDMQILGLVWAGKPAPADRVAQLIALQRTGGGWAQAPGLPTDAYATAQAMQTLLAAGMKTSDPVYQRGVSFLVSTQQKDGTWHVATRAFSFQPYFESGFPYGHDQWISHLGTAMASMALAPDAR
jgi:N-acyl-D-amino-acid deacylase